MIRSTVVNVVDVGAMNISESAEIDGEISGVSTVRVTGKDVDILGTDGVNILTESVSSDEDIGIIRETDRDGETTKVDDKVGSTEKTGSEDMKKNVMVELDSGMGNEVAVTVTSSLVCGKELDGVGMRDENVVRKLGDWNGVVTSSLDDNVRLGVGDSIESKVEDGDKEVIDAATELEDSVATLVSLEVVCIVLVTSELIVLDEVFIVVTIVLDALDNATILLESITSMLEGTLKENVLVGVGVITISTIVVMLSKSIKLLITN